MPSHPGDCDTLRGMWASRGRTVIWFVLAGAVAALANGPRVLALAAWLAPLFWLRALQGVSVRSGALLGGLVYGAATAVAARGMLPLAGGLYLLAALGIGMGAVAPFVVQRALAPRLPRPLIPLVLPVVATAMEFLGGRLQPFGSFGAVAYTQVGWLGLVQVAAVAGLPGIAFLIYLPAALVHWAVEFRPSPAELRRAGLAFALLLAAVGLGTARLHRDGGDAPVVPVAVVSSPLNGRVSELLAPAYATGDPAAVDWLQALHQGELATADLLRRTQRAAQAGARIIVWPETAALVAAESESTLLRTAGALARNHRVYLALALGVVRHRARPWPAGDGALDNKVTLLGPRGEVVAEYRKGVAVPGPEAELLVPGSGDIPLVPTPYGRLAMAICFDLDFPRLMRRAAGADLVLVPAEDWRGITPYHSDMARLRAIEGGYSLVRATRYGRSLAADARGRLLAMQEDSPWPAEDPLLLAQVPLRGVRTLYERTGDAFGWLTVGAFFLLGLCALARRRRGAGAILVDERPTGAGDHRETSP